MSCKTVNHFYRKLSQLTVHMFLCPLKQKARVRVMCSISVEAHLFRTRYFDLFSQLLCNRSQTVKKFFSFYQTTTPQAKQTNKQAKAGLLTVNQSNGSNFLRKTMIKSGGCKKYRLLSRYDCGRKYLATERGCLHRLRSPGSPFVLFASRVILRI